MVEIVLDYDTLEAGQQFPSILIVLDADLVEAYIRSTGHDHPLFATPYAPPLICNLVRFVHGSLGGKWPAGTVHLNQDIEIRRPLKRDETVTLDVRVGSKTVRGDRSYIEFVTTTRDADQQIVSQGLMRMLWRGAAQASAPRSKASPSSATSPTGREVEPLTVDVSHAMVAAYAEVAAARDPIHLDPSYAKQTRFGKSIAQGLLVLSFLSRWLTRVYGERWISGGKLSVRFARPAMVGESVTVRGIERELAIDDPFRHCVIWCENAQGEALVEGEAVIPPERPDEALQAWRRVYEGLEEDDISQIEAITLDRHRLMRQEP